MNSFFKEAFSRYLFLSIASSLFMMISCHGQTARLIGIDYSLLKIGPSDVQYGTDYTHLNKNYSAYEMNFLSLRKNFPVSFRYSLAYTSVQWTHYEYRDARYPYNYYASPLWEGTQTNGRTQNLGLSAYMMFSTKDELIKGFFALGYEFNASLYSQSETYMKYEWQHYDSINNVHVHDSTTNNLTEKKSNGFLFGSTRVGFQAGCIAKLSSRFYLSVSIRAAFFREERIIPINNPGFIYSVDFGLHYQLNSPKTIKSPPN